MVVDFNGSEKFVPEKNAGELSTKAGNKMMEEVTKCMGGGPGIKCEGASLHDMPVLPSRTQVLMLAMASSPQTKILPQDLWRKPIWTATNNCPAKR